MTATTRAFLRNERGEGKIGLIIAILVVGLAVHVGMKIIPHKIETSEFQQTIEDSLLNLAANVMNEESFLVAVTEKAEELEIPVREDTIQLNLSGDLWTFRTEYDVSLKMIWGDWVQHVEIERQQLKF